MLQFRRVILKNWRNFLDVDVQFGKCAFIIGPNASGKSNLLDVFRFLRDLAKPGGGLQRSVEERGGLKMMHCLAARAHPDVEISAEMVDTAKETAWTYEIGIRQEPSGHKRALLRYERVKRQSRLITKRPDRQDDADPERLTQTSLEQINANKEFRPLVECFSAISYVHLVPQLVRHPDISGGRLLDQDPFGQAFLRRLAETPENYRRARLDQIGKLLRSAVPQLKDLKYRIDNAEGGLPHLEAGYEHWRPSPVLHREREFSDGTLRLIGLLWSILEGDSLLLLEEPEISLHSEVVARLAALIYKMNRRHSDRFLSVRTVLNCSPIKA